MSHKSSGKARRKETKVINPEALNHLYFIYRNIDAKHYHLLLNSVVFRASPPRQNVTSQLTSGDRGSLGFGWNHKKMKKSFSW